MSELGSLGTDASPPAMLIPGARSGAYHVGVDELLMDGVCELESQWRIIAVAILDEAERPTNVGARYTVANQERKRRT